MKNLKELKENCILIAEFKNQYFVCKNGKTICRYSTAIKNALYSDNNGKYYHYKYINKGQIIEYDNYEIAIKRFTDFINIMLEK